jgi:hypothetical protein
MVCREWGTDIQPRAWLWAPWVESKLLFHEREMGSLAIDLIYVSRSEQKEITVGFLDAANKYISGGMVGYLIYTDMQSSFNFD